MIEMYKVLPLLMSLLTEGLILGSQKLFHSKKDLTWNEAKEYCRARGADLIFMKDENEKINYKIVDGWIDLRRDPASSVWTWYRKSRVDTSLTWENGDPGDGEDCAYHKSGENGLHSSSCDVNRSFMCKKVMLLLVTENKTWEEALNHCRALEVKNPRKPINSYRNFNFDLATLLTKRHHKFLKQIAKKATTDEVWIGLHYLAGYWLWVGGENVMYEDIEKCPRNGFCGTWPKAGNKSYKIRHCHEKRNFFCYRWEWASNKNDTDIDS